MPAMKVQSATFLWVLALQCKDHQNPLGKLCRIVSS